MLPRIKRRYASYQYVLVGADFFSEGGAWRSIYLLYRYLETKGVSVLLIDLRRGDGWRQWVCALLFSPRIIVNGMAALTRWLVLCGLNCRHDANVYLHDTAFSLDALQYDKPYLYNYLAQLLKSRTVLCVSSQMADLYLNRFGARNTVIVHEITQIQPEPVLQPGIFHIVMVGTLCRRKGYNLFVDVAEYASCHALPWQFHWIGGLGESDLAPVSQIITWWGWRESAAPLLRQADLFFLSSVDDPQPLACLEALSYGKRVVAYAGTGTAELIRGLVGCQVYDEYVAIAAVDAIREAFECNPELDSYYTKLDKYASVHSFLERIEGTLSDHSTKLQ